MKELSEIFEISPASAHDRINQLVRKGYLKREDGKSRGIAVARRPSEMAASLVSVPVVGMVAAGCPSWRKRTSPAKYWSNRTSFVPVSTSHSVRWVTAWSVPVSTMVI